MLKNVCFKPDTVTTEEQWEKAANRLETDS